MAGAPLTVPSVDFRGLEMQLRQITARIEALQPTNDFEKSIAAIRSDLAEIARQISEALPRRAVESLAIEVRALGERIDHSRQCGVDAKTLTNLERGLGEIREALGVLTPAENLIGFDATVKALSQKLDAVLAKDDPSALQQLEAAIGNLRGVVSHVASSDTLTRVAEDVRALAAQVDGIANNAATGHAVSALEQRLDALASQVDGIPSRTATEHAFAALEQRIDTLVSNVHGLASDAATEHAVSALEQRIETLTAALTASSEAGRAVPHDLEKLLAGLIEKLEWVQLTHTDHAALAHLEDRIAMLVQRFDASDARLGHLEAVERGLADLLVHIEEIRRANPAAAAAPALDRDIVEIKQSERRTQDSLEAVQNTVEHLVDRLATVESELRAAPRQKSESAAATAPSLPPYETEAVVADVGKAPAAPAPNSWTAVARVPIDPNLPPDHPLEPGSSATRPLPGTSAADRITGSEAAGSSGKPPVIPDPERPNFIAAARRAAQAAVWEPSAKKTTEAGAAGAAAQPRAISQRLRKLMIAGGVVLILIGCVRIATRLFEDRSSAASSQVQSEEPLPHATAPKTVAPRNPTSSDTPTPPSSNPTSVAPPNTPPVTNAEKPGRQSMLQGVNDHLAAAPMAAPTSSSSAAEAMPFWASPEITGALPSPQRVSSIPPASDQTKAVVDDKLPATIGDSALRKAALAGDPAAAYEVGIRFFEGRGVLQNNEAAAHWLERAAKGGLAPAQFRLGALYEKGLGIKKDLAVARDLYLAAAEKGNANAMHNLAVLYAEGGAGGPDYDKAATWFHQAADRGITDSQYNLGILYARGIGVAQNDAESYKWFALAAAQGDKEAAKKREEMASHLDAQSLGAARLAVKRWTPKPQPDDAVTVKTMAAWDARPKSSRPQQQD